MAQRADIVLEAAPQCTDPDIVFVVIGAGSERETLAARQAELKLPNFRLIEKQSKKMLPYFLELSDVCIVHLRDAPLFRTVIPSKIFEAMVMRKPIVLGVRGEASEIVEEAGAGLSVAPDDADALLNAVKRLRNDKELYRTLADNGFNYVRLHHDRKKMARRYWTLIRNIADGTPPSETAQQADYQLD